MNRLGSLLRFALLSSVCSCGGCWCETGDAAEPVAVAQAAGCEDQVRVIEPQAKQVLEAFGAYIKSLDSFSVNELVEVRMQAEGMKVEVDMKQVVRVKRPNMLYVVSEGGGFAAQMGTALVSDGEKAYRSMAALKRYTETEAPATLDEISTGLSLGSSAMGQEDPLTQALVSDDPMAKLLQVVTAAHYVGLEKVDDQECHHLRLETSELHWDAWFTTGDNPLPVKQVPDFAPMIAKVAEEAGDDNPLAGLFKDMQMQQLFKDFKANPPLTSADFAFTPPEGSEKVDELFAGLPGGGGLAVEKLLGLPAPAFELELYGGGQASLAANKDKVVMLDFWASWCGPCREALPKVVALADKYKDKGLVFYAVNLQEDADTIREALEADGLAMPVAMDIEGIVAEAYKANAIPQTVLIGRDGTVQAVHVGGSPELEEQLTSEIEALLEGRQLAEPPSEEPASAEVPVEQGDE